MINVLKRLLRTLSYVSSLPLGDGKFYQDCPENDESSESGLSGLSKYLPTAGLVIGCFLLGIGLLCLWTFKTTYIVTGAVLTVSWIALTGGLHFDGLMDTADGIFSHRNRERILEIMMDSRVGNFGAMTGLAVLLLKFASLVSLCAHPFVLLPLLVVSPAWARWCELYSIGRFPYAKESGKGKIWHDTTKMPADLLTGMLAPLVVSAALGGLFGLPCILMIVLTTCASGLALSHYLAHVIKGQTGDTYGAVVELAETGGLLLVSLIACN